MEKAYYTPKNPGSYGGVDRLRRATNRSRKDVEQFLAGQKTYQLHKPRRTRFKRRRYIVSGIDDLWQADLADMQKISRQNGGYNFLLVVIDVFSKFLWVKPLKNKTAMITLDAIDQIIIDSQRKPKNFMTDKGTEFVNEPTQRYFDNVNVNYYTANNPETKAAVAERVIRTLKGKIYKYMTKSNSKRYIDALEDIVSSYNNSVHRSIKMKPINVTKSTEDKARKNLYPISIIDSVPKYRFKVGDTVKVALTPSTFSKGYLPQWSEENFTVVKRQETIPPTYKIKDSKGERVTGSFYEPELQYIADSSEDEIEY